MSEDDAIWEGSEETYNDPEEKKVIFGALDSFYQYAKVAHFNITHLRRQSFYTLPRAHWELLAAPPFSYLDTLIQVDDAIDKNAELAMAIFQSGLQSFGISSQPKGVNSEGEKDPDDWRGSATSNDLEKARSTLRQFYRDWSEDGSVEREACYGPIIRAIQEEQANRSQGKSQLTSMRVLVPGAGLGRLVFELCALGFHTEGNEISYHQLLASSYVLNRCPERKFHTLFPWAHTFSNHQNRTNHLRSCQIPDVHPGTELPGDNLAGDMSMSASDFLCLYGNESQQDAFDVVATVFFLDTAPNLIHYLEAVRNCLKSGGLLVNFGPLLWHFENNSSGPHGRERTSSEEEGSNQGRLIAANGFNLTGNLGIADPGSFELTDDEVVALVEKLGFHIEKHEIGIAAPYIQDTNSMLQNTYRASHWVARKR
ncbi:hypothetical protein B7494_g5987 [Chlorociboria aeruginascens]|nr:hypothetical protein B7494_g5987 [Chlorociboria aeruginascens]